MMHLTKISVPDLSLVLLQKVRSKRNKRPKGHTKKTSWRPSRAANIYFRKSTMLMHQTKIRVPDPSLVLPLEYSGLHRREHRIGALMPDRPLHWCNITEGSLDSHLRSTGHCVQVTLILHHLCCSLNFSYIMTTQIVFMVRYVYTIYTTAMSNILKKNI